MEKEIQIIINVNNIEQAEEAISRLAELENTRRREAAKELRIEVEASERGYKKSIMNLLKENLPFFILGIAVGCMLFQLGIDLRNW
ncbi:hypothetical protein HCA00_04810 [Listeria booriae]|uniref:hypothetical protein n=1 Tax=Listeria booriae TaxID=1552123 RepID=UPI00164DF139|nr:hypothetical protein [Listeria booriae]MBC6128104.1 hypothetical protein [Listeria booriae]